MTRNDPHAPSNLVTEDYEYVFAFDNDGGLRGLNQTDEGRAFMAEIRNKLRLSPMADRGTHQCHHCGARIRYVGILHHVPTGAYIAVGETCMENRFDRASADFHALRAAAALDRQAQRIKTEATAFVSGLTAGDAKVALTRETVLTETFPFIEEGSYAHSTINDIKRKIWNLYGNASERQIAFVAKLIAEARDRAVVEVQRAAEIKVQAPTGRIEVEGVVVKRAFYDSMYGGAFKITVKVDDAQRGGVWLFFVTEPSSITTERGDIVRLTATFERSDRDASFAFGKRPSKAQIVGKVSDEVASSLD